jgi:hypothetical protein
LFWGGQQRRPSPLLVLLMSRSCTTAFWLDFWMPLALLSCAIAFGLVIPRHLRLSCPG